MSVADTRRTILDATMLVLERHGVQRLAVDDVARQADLSRQTIYRYFGNREGLLNAAIVREEEAFIVAIEAAANATDDLEDAIRTAFRVGLELVDSHALLQRLLATEPEMLLPLLTTGRGPVLSAARPLMLRLLGSHAEGLDAAIDLEIAADLAARIFLSYATSPSWDRERAVETVSRVIMRGLS